MTISLQVKPQLESVSRSCEFRPRIESVIIHGGVNQQSLPHRQYSG